MGSRWRSDQRKLLISWHRASRELVVEALEGLHNDGWTNAATKPPKPGSNRCPKPWSGLEVQRGCLSMTKAFPSWVAQVEESYEQAV